MTILELNKIHQGDCLELMKDIPNKSIDLIVIDPPYNIGKDKRWDKYKKDEYSEFMGAVFKECERTLKENGSFYWFHNDMVQVKDLMARLEENTGFIYKQFIVWNKRFENLKNKGFLDGFIEVEGLRNYQKMAEYCLFYTFQDESEGNPCLKVIQDYLETERKKQGIRYEELNEICGYKAIARKWMTDYKQPRLIQRKDYEKIAPILNLDKTYDELLDEYESLKYTFNNQKTHHSVWEYEVAPKLGHVTPKPVELVENILRHSSNPGDVVLDCFIGSGTTAVASLNTRRQFIGIEKEQEYVDIANERINQNQLTLDIS